MAITEIYVDPSIAADSGAGTIGDPYGDLEYAIKQTTFDTTNGTRVNIKAGTDEVLAAGLETALANAVTTPAWVPSETAPCIFQGYTATAGDGGIGGISGGGAVGILGGGANTYIHFIDLHLHNTGANYIVNIDNYCVLFNCELNNSTGGGVTGDLGMIVNKCYFHDISGNGVNMFSASIENCRFEDGATNQFTTAAIVLFGSAGFVKRNIIKVSGACHGIQLFQGSECANNSIYSDGGTGSGITTASPNYYLASVMNNLVEGFSGAGGYGINLTAAATQVWLYGGNSVYNCETAFGGPSGHIIHDLGGDETLTASPFNDAANGDFSPVDVGLVREGSVPAAFHV